MPSAPAAQSDFRYGGLPRADQLGARSPSTERMATSVGSVGGLFQSGAQFGAGALGANFSLILISE
jgi:hypothetical protein